MTDDPRPAEQAGCLHATPQDPGAKLPPAVIGRRWLIVSTMIAGLLVLISLWRVHEFGIPGVSICLALPLGLAGGLSWLIGALYTSRAAGPPVGRNVRLLVVSALLAVVAGGLAKTTIIPRAYFDYRTRPALDKAVLEFQAAQLRPQTRPTDYYRVSYDSQVGDFYIDEVGVDAFNGLWFRTGTYLDFIDKVSYGYYYRPPGAAMPVRSTGEPTSPFGAAHFYARPLGDGWYYFSVSDDWY